MTRTRRMTMHSRALWPRIASALSLCVSLAFVSACTIVKVYQGSKIRGNPAAIVVGKTTMEEVLADFGAPNRIQRRGDGDVFVYSYLRRDSKEISIEEELVTNAELLTYTTIQEKSDRLVVLFDANGIVKARGFAFETRELDGDEQEED